jgi:hypothetical protein
VRRTASLEVGPRAPPPAAAPALLPRVVFISDTGEGAATARWLHALAPAVPAVSLAGAAPRALAGGAAFGAAVATRGWLTAEQPDAAAGWVAGLEGQVEEDEDEEGVALVHGPEPITPVLEPQLSIGSLASGITAMVERSTAAAVAAAAAAAEPGSAWPAAAAAAEARRRAAPHDSFLQLMEEYGEED